ncbi:MAG: hypothetical protein GF317_16730, partial [Candidatus Lokiarchaeota archaeon]|nr:hypothetical protein [Candidatus Lokiarchaeota archaeon]MBD3201163.1 hypothetical protein [Candidatus Lokiarchaeota archaeon]
MNEIDYGEIITQLENELNAQCAIANKYGIVLGSVIPEFAKGKVIPQKILELISDRQDIAEELNLDKITSFALESKDNNYLFTFSEELILISKLGLDVNLAKFMPSIRMFVKNLSEKSKEKELGEFSNFDFSKEISQIKETVKKESYKS